MKTDKKERLGRAILRERLYGRTTQPIKSWWRLKIEETTAAVREWLKIIIPTLALSFSAVALVFAARAYSTQSAALQETALSANIALASRLSSQRVDVENAQIKLGLLQRSFDEMMQLNTWGFIKGKELDPNELTRASDIIAQVRMDRDALEASTHALPFEAFKAVRKYYITAAVFVEQFARDLDSLPKDSRLQAVLNPDPSFIEMLKKDGYPPPKPFPRFADAYGSARLDTFKDHFAAVKALIDAGGETEKQWSEVERAINANPSPP
ncbi:hypothetical protein [Bradyrhizobium sp. AZCC 2289]|uniref:hypothetical protein n=1 Tax=Bradyrhizobium sp. AZCC 2289 TaxID=3117026 RepID=UPI002FF072B4